MSVPPARRPEAIRNLVDAGRYADAQAELSTAIAASPNDPYLYGLLAQCHIGLDDASGALTAARRTVALASDEAWGHRLSSVALQRAGRSDEALAAAAESVRLDPHRWESHARYAGAAMSVFGRNHDGLAAARAAVALAPEEPGAHVILGRVHARLDQRSEARAAYLRALALDPDHADARNNLATLDGVRLGRKTRGCLAALRSAPGHEAARENLANLLRRVSFRLWFAGGFALLAGMVATAGGRPLDESQPGPASYAVIGLLLIGSAAYLFSLARHIPPGVLRELWHQHRRSRWAVPELVATGLLAGAVAVVCTVPGTAKVGEDVVWLMFLVVTAIRIVTFVRPRRG